MPLEILGPMVLLSILAVVALVHFSGVSGKELMDSEDVVATQFLSDYPDAKIASVEVNEQKSAALLFLRNSQIGLITTMGARHFSRILDLDKTKVDFAKDLLSLRIQFIDFTLPVVQFKASNTRQYKTIEDRFREIRLSRNNSSAST